MSALGFTFLPKNWFLLGILIAVLGGHVVPGAGGALDPAGLLKSLLGKAVGSPAD